MNQPFPDLMAVLSGGEVLHWFDKPRKAVPTYALGFLTIACVIIVIVATPAAYASVTGDMSIFAGGWFTLNDVPLTATSDPALLVQSLLISALLWVAMLVLAVLMGISIRSERYGLTNMRLIRLRTFPWRKVTSINRTSIALLDRNQARTSGSLSLVAVGPEGPARLQRIFYIPTIILHDIADPANVEHLLLAHMSQRTGRHE